MTAEASSIFSSQFIDKYDHSFNKGYIYKFVILFSFLDLYAIMYFCLFAAFGNSSVHGHHAVFDVCVRAHRQAVTIVATLQKILFLPTDLAAHLQPFNSPSGKAKMYLMLRLKTISMQIHWTTVTATCLTQRHGRPRLV